MAWTRGISGFNVPTPSCAVAARGALRANPSLVLGEGRRSLINGWVRAVRGLAWGRGSPFGSRDMEEFFAWTQKCLLDLSVCLNFGLSISE